MIDSLTKIISHFPGAANRARCTAHIVNLVTKIILRQFDARKKTKGAKKTSGNANDNKGNDERDNKELEVTELVDEEDEINSVADGLDREEQEVADDEDDEMSENVADDLDEIEEALKEEVSEVGKKVKPIQRVLFKVCLNSLIVQYYSLIPYYYSFFALLMYTFPSFFLSAPETFLCNQEVDYNPSPSMERNS